MTPAEIDIAEAALLDLVKIGSVLNATLAIASPFLTAFIKYEFSKLRVGIADGSIVPDGQGGFVPNTNSHYDPRTGRFV